MSDLSDLFRALASTTEAVHHKPGTLQPLPRVEIMPSESKAVNGGVQHIYKFENGYGASVVQHSFSYGAEHGLWELAVLGPNGRICYETPITDDVLGHLDDQEIASLLADISSLPASDAS